MWYRKVGSNRLNRKIRNPLVLGSALALVATAVFIALSGSPESSSAVADCKVGDPPSLELPRAPTEGGTGKQVPAVVVGCFETPQGLMELVTSHSRVSRCFAADFPKLGTSLGGACLSTRDAAVRQCAVCVSNIGKIGDPPSSVVLGEVSSSVKRVIVEGMFNMHREVAIAHLAHPLQGDRGPRGITLFAAVFPNCGQPQSVRVKPISRNRKPFESEIDLSLAQRCGQG